MLTRQQAPIFQPLAKAYVSHDLVPSFAPKNSIFQPTSVTCQSPQEPLKIGSLTEDCGLLPMLFLPSVMPFLQTCLVTHSSFYNPRLPSQSPQAPTCCQGALTTLYSPISLHFSPSTILGAPSIPFICIYLMPTRGPSKCLLNE